MTRWALLYSFALCVLVLLLLAIRALPRPAIILTTWECPQGTIPCPHEHCHTIQ